MSDNKPKTSPLLELENAEREKEEAKKRNQEVLRKSDLQARAETLRQFSSYSYQDFVTMFREDKKYRPVDSIYLFEQLDPEKFKAAGASEPDVLKIRMVSEVAKKAWDQVLTEKPNIFQRTLAKLRR